MSDKVTATLVLAKKVQAKVEATLMPLEREMAIMKWEPEYRRIIWEAVARHAMNKAVS